MRPEEEAMEALGFYGPHADCWRQGKAWCGSALCHDRREAGQALSSLVSQRNALAEALRLVVCAGCHAAVGGPPKPPSPLPECPVCRPARAALGRVRND